MKKLFVLVAFAALLGAPAAVCAQSSMMMSGAGTGPHAYEWMLGTWTCQNAIPSALAGPAVQTLTATRGNIAGTIVWRYTGTDYDQYGFLAYAPKTKRGGSPGPIRAAAPATSRRNKRATRRCGRA